MKILYARIRTTSAILILLLFFVQNSVAQSDLCTGAVPALPIGTSCVATNYVIPMGYTNAMPVPAIPCGTLTSRKDGWFTITTGPTTNNITVNASASVTSGTIRFGLVLYSGTCGALTNIACTAGLPSSMSLPSVTVLPNTTYFLRIVIYTSMLLSDVSGAVCVLDTTIRDNCVDSIALPVNNNSVCTNTIDSTTFGATQSLVGCAGNADDDVWFSLVPTNATHYITVKGTTLIDPVLEMFSGTCAGLVSIGCVNGLTGSTEDAVATGLTIGATYYIRIYSFGGAGSQGTFNICVTSPDNPAPYCVAEGSDPTLFINNFATTGGFSNITNPSGYSTAGYGNYTAQSVVAMANSTVNFSTSFSGGTFGFNIWVDWNNNNVFDAAERVFNSGSPYVTFVNNSFTIPAGQMAGNYRMRIRAHWLSYDPPACGNNNYGEVEDYTLTVQPLLCNTVPGGLNVTAITTTTANFNWSATSPVPASGYNYYYSTTATPPAFGSSGSGNIAAPGTTAPLSGLVPNTTYYVWVRSNCGGANGMGTWAGPISFTTFLSTTGVTTCQGGSGSLSAVGSCTGQTASMTISGSWNTNPVAYRPATLIANSPTCAFGLYTATYHKYDFQVSVTGTYVLTMVNNPNYDGMAYIVSGSFTPGLCGSGIWIVGDDDSGTGLEPKLTTTLNAGTQYTLISTYYNTSNNTRIDNFSYTVTGPGSILTGTPGVMQWYTAASGGSPIGTGNIFNPVGVAGSGLPNTNTPGTTTFYAACSGTPTVRTATNFVITAGPTSVLTGSGSICNNDAVLNVILTGTGPWSVTYQNNIGGPAVTLNGILTNPVAIPVSPSATATYTITAMSNGSCPSVSNTGSAIFTANTWLGGTANWTTATNWSSGVVPTSSDCVIIAPTIIPATIANLDFGYAGEIVVKNGGRLDVTNQRTLTVTNNLQVEATGIVNITNSSSLLQINNTVNTGKINMQRITQPMYRYDYTYWNSPVTLASNFTLLSLSPGTLSDKFYRWQPTISNGPGNWIQLPPATTNMDPTNGYIVRAPQTFSTSSAPIDKQLFTATFIGTPNNGNINIPVSKGTLPALDERDKLNLIGNPYPSAFDADMFLNTNSALIDATMYFWTHNSAPSTLNSNPFYGSYSSNYSSSDYAIRNYMGGTVASSGGLPPGQFVAAGSSFFVLSKVASGNVLFNNLMRVANNNNQFYRPSGENVTSTPDTALEKHRFWLNMMDNSSAFSQILIGYASGATLEFDNGYDASRLNSEGTNFYSVIDNYRLAIQGRPLPFDPSDVIPLGYVTNINTELSIGIDSTDPLFLDYEIFLEDKTLNIIHNLKLAPYYFTSTVGRFDDRFVLRFTDNALNIDGHLGNSMLTAFVKDQFLNVKSSESIETITIFDVSGKRITTLRPETPIGENRWRFPFAQGAYFATIKFSSGLSATRKLLN